MPPPPRFSNLPHIPSLTLKPTHKAVAAYYDSLAKFAQLGIKYETAVRSAFHELLEHCARQFDLIVLDPPSLAKRETERAGALGAHRQLIASGLAHLRRGGVLVAASCSAHVTFSRRCERQRNHRARISKSCKPVCIRRIIPRRSRKRII